MGRTDTYFVKEHYDADNKFTEHDMIGMLEFFIDNNIVAFDETTLFWHHFSIFKTTLFG